MSDRQPFYEARASFRPRESNHFYQRLLRRYFSFFIPPGSTVLEVGCGIGDLLAAVQPSRGVGIDFSPAMIEIARQRHPDLTFHAGSAETFPAGETFDYIILSDLVNDLSDVQNVFENLRRHSHPDTRIVLNFYNTLWSPVLKCAEKLGWKSPTPPQNWLSGGDLNNLLFLAGWEVLKTDSRILCPINIPLLAPLLNRYVAPFTKHFCLTVFAVARARPAPSPVFSRERNGWERPHFSCSVVIPARNESGNIEAAVQRTPEMGLGTEIIFVEGHSKDDTWDEIHRVAAKYPDRKIKILKQIGAGKGSAVREAFAAATGDLLFILDADLTMPPEELPKFYEVARGGIDFVNGVRLVYPMEDEAMRFANIIGNKFFSLAFSWLLGQPLKDTLCGTKVLFRSKYELIAKNRSYFGEFDPFGDFDLLFGAAKLNLRIVDLPIRYRARTYGETNISRWKHGFLLLRMVIFAAKRLKFFA
jgi:SAM-dependent methyltransferase